MMEPDQQLTERVHELVLEYAGRIPPGGAALGPLSLRKDLEIDSLSLVSLTLRVGEACGVDIVELGLDLDLGSLETVADLVKVGQKLLEQPR